MSVFSKKDPVLLFVGDIIAFVLSLWITLIFRYGFRVTGPVFKDHLIPFIILFAAWYVVFFIAGLYDKYAVILGRNLTRTILYAQILNIGIAIAFFYFIPYFGITPKTNLFIYLAISCFLVLLWRMYGYRFVGTRRKQNALLISTGEEMRELEQEVNGNSRYGLKIVGTIDVSEPLPENMVEVLRDLYQNHHISIIALDFTNSAIYPFLPKLYELMFSRVVFINIHTMYEDVFNRIPLSLIGYDWFLQNVSVAPKYTYDLLKRLMDIVVGSILMLIALPFVACALLFIAIDDGRPLFFIQDRVGKNNRIIRNIKLRTMSVHEEKDGLSKNPEITRIGQILRKTRIDEFPQFLNVIRGDVSLIGPRPEIPVLVDQYKEEIPYYNIRHLIQPGLSGWAQLYQKDPPKSVANPDKTKAKLSYDLYYIKNRSFILDVKIALKTIKELLSRSGV